MARKRPASPAQKKSPAQPEDRGTAGELHQRPGRGDERLTTNVGIPLADNQNSLRGGTRGPTLIEDFILREKIHHFDHERIPERIVHARGSAAHWLQIFRDYYGPTHKAFAALEAPQAAALAEEITALLERLNIGGSRSLVVPGEYLEVVITKR